MMIIYNYLSTNEPRNQLLKRTYGDNAPRINNAAVIISAARLLYPGLRAQEEQKASHE
jgi:hypothetical protein